MDTAKFRNVFPEFACPSTYPQASIDFWASLAVEMLSVSRWGRKYEHGLFLFVAHNLVLAGQDDGEGGTPGMMTGVVTSERVGDLAASYDASSVANPKDGIWNLTTYGKRYRDLMRMIGSGGYVVS